MPTVHPKLSLYSAFQGNSVLAEEQNTQNEQLDIVSHAMYNDLQTLVSSTSKSYPFPYGSFSPEPDQRNGLDHGEMRAFP